MIYTTINPITYKHWHTNHRNLTDTQQEQHLQHAYTNKIKHHLYILSTVFFLVTLRVAPTLNLTLKYKRRKQNSNRGYENINNHGCSVLGK